ncbi:GNAT family N-acetyltransferase [Microvirga pudoricolor]|uniref:GNAT family N-acetyltransferase n=1 Tax=Microvirga pudoricolor TaxID=2778729 RepID=UPI00194F2AD8|nr:GNAT family N-acetyltransferase [Microvirga pudoricolor]MBM6594961.1 GNAT family N-acetyltransferase [Microvirga pudoricolor]
MTIRLRAAVPADREAVVEFIHRLNVFEAALTGDRRQDYGAARGYYGELQQRISRNGGRIVLAIADRQVIGIMGFSLDEDAAYITDDVRRHGTVTDLVVAEEWRGRGVGQTLLQEAERLTREAGFKRLMIGALAANERARRTYEAFGFAPYVEILTKEL